VGIGDAANVIGRGSAIIGIASGLNMLALAHWILLHYMSHPEFLWSLSCRKKSIKLEK
jgi:hypothetical protein